MNKLKTEPELLAIIKAQLELKTIDRLALELNYNYSMLSLVVAGKRPISNVLAKKLGYKMVRCFALAAQTEV